MAGTCLKSSAIVLTFAVALAAHANPYALEVVDSAGLKADYEAAKALGSPSLSEYDEWAGADIDISMCYGPWSPDTIAALESGGYVTVRFDSPIVNDPGHWYGADFIVFGGSSFLAAGGWVEPDTDMADFWIGQTGAAFGKEMTVSVSQDGQTWHPFVGPLAGRYWPTQAYSRWDADAVAWDHTSISDFRLPMNPNLVPEDFADMTVVDALALYDGAAGGTAFDIGALGLDWVEYVRVDGPGNIDAFAKVRPVPEPATALILVIGAAALVVRRRVRK